MGVAPCIPKKQNKYLRFVCFHWEVSHDKYTLLHRTYGKQFEFIYPRYKVASLIRSHRI